MTQGTLRVWREATGGPVEIDLVAQTYLCQCGAFAKDMGLRPKAAAAYDAVVGGAHCDGLIFLMPPEVPEMFKLLGVGNDPLLGELPCDCSVVCGDTPPLRWGVPECSRDVTVVRVGVEGGVVESPGADAHKGAGLIADQTQSCG